MTATHSPPTPEENIGHEHPQHQTHQLIAKLKEMFQMDQADLDFGIYRIMNAKRDEVERFLDKDLLPTLRTTLPACDTSASMPKPSNIPHIPA